MQARSKKTADSSLVATQAATVRRIFAATLLCALTACSQKTPEVASTAKPATAAQPAPGWTANGATACDTYLTPDFVGDIFAKPQGHAEKLSVQGCAYNTANFGSINITLMAAGTFGLDQHMPYLTNPVPLAGVGDKAVRTATGIEAAKGGDRMCAIDVMPPFGNKLSGEPLAQKLGTICNKLFALP